MWGAGQDVIRCKQTEAMKKHVKLSREEGIINGGRNQEEAVLQRGSAE